ncbi:MAG: M23 family metallopeptidase [Anaerolineaceae bacterium]|nr:MAG: M23 family metallopeptidase [Anaerolineaceae bacterium]
MIGGRVRFRDQEVPFFPDSDDEDTFYALVVAGVDLTANRDYEITALALRENGDSVTINGTARVVLGGFIRQDVTIPADRAYLIDPIVERTELARLNSLFEQYTAEQLWDEDGFMLPVQAETTSPFGAFRVFNETTESRHTGWDFRTATGTPIRAMGAGRVVFAGLLDIRGNHVVIDHGYGIFSGYSHFSQTHVTRGQAVRSGQIIGVSGNTGRSSGPHLHWEIAVNGEWVDSLDFLRMWIPPAAPSEDDDAVVGT